MGSHLTWPPWASSVGRFFLDLFGVVGSPTKNSSQCGGRCLAEGLFGGIFQYFLGLCVLF